MDRCGMTGFPMRLTVAAILLSVCLPAIAGMADDFGGESSITDGESQARIIRETASSLYYSGPGSSKNVELRIPAGYEILIGGEGAQSYAVSVMKDGTAVSTGYMQYPAVRFSGGTEVSGIVTLSLRCINVDGGCVIEVRQV